MSGTILSAHARSDRLARLLGRLGSVGFGAFSRAFALGSQFVVLLLLGKLLPKSDFGDFMIAFALMRVLSQGLGTGIATLLIYHVSRDASVEREAGLHRSAVLLGAFVTGLVSIALVAAAPVIAEVMQKPSMVFWIRSMTPFMLVSTLLTISTGALDGRGRITRSIVYAEFVPNLVRLLLLPPFLLFGWGSPAVVGIMTVSVMLPWLALIAARPRGAAARFESLTRWDLLYAGKLTIHSFAAMQFQGIDMLVVGALFSSESAADYAIASRVAALIPFFQQIIVKGFMSIAARAIHDGDTVALQAAVDRARRSATSLVTMTAAASLLFFPFIVWYLGDFARSTPLLAALALSPIIRSHYVGADALLRIAGFADLSLGVMLASSMLVVMMPLVGVKLLGTYSVAVGMFLSSTVLNPLMSRIIWRQLHVRLDDRWTVARIVLACAAIALYVAVPTIVGWLGAVGLLGASIVTRRAFRLVSMDWPR